MTQAFRIRFDFPFAHSDLTVSLRASAALHHSDPYFVVDEFYFASAPQESREVSLIPAQELKRIYRDEQPVWVHRDSERESQLSIAIGNAIEQELGKQGLSADKIFSRSQ
jgi:hypothetical protein